MKKRMICKRCHHVRPVNEARLCDECLAVRKKEEAPRRPETPRSIANDSILELRKDTEAMKLLGDLVELEKVPPERGGYHFSDWERGFIKSCSEQDPPIYSEAQRSKIKDIWQAA